MLVGSIACMICWGLLGVFPEQVLKDTNDVNFIE
jgi:hypothetical protein